MAEEQMDIRAAIEFSRQLPKHLAALGHVAEFLDGVTSLMGRKEELIVQVAKLTAETASMAEKVAEAKAEKLSTIAATEASVRDLRAAQDRDAVAVHAAAVAELEKVSKASAEAAQAFAKQRAEQKALLDQLKSELVMVSAQTRQVEAEYAEIKARLVRFLEPPPSA